MMSSRQSGFALIAGALALLLQTSARAEDQFRLLDASQIRARMVGNDITDGPHWSMYLRPDGKLISAESGSSWTGIWKIQGNKLCRSLPSSTSVECNEGGCREQTSECAPTRNRRHSTPLSPSIAASDEKETGAKSGTRPV